MPQIDNAKSQRDNAASHRENTSYCPLVAFLCKRTKSQESKNNYLVLLALNSKDWYFVIYCCHRVGWSGKKINIANLNNSMYKKSHQRYLIHVVIFSNSNQIQNVCCKKTERKD